jgi:hypothetical protein
MGMNIMYTFAAEKGSNVLKYVVLILSVAILSLILLLRIQSFSAVQHDI